MRYQWVGTPEIRIIRELYETNKGGLEPGTKGRDYGRIFEKLLIRELQVLTTRNSDDELRFAHGFIVEDYGDPETGEVSLDDQETLDITGPRFDVVCYHGNVAWTTVSGIPFAVVPKTLADAVIEAKRTVTPKRFGPDSNEHFNEQLRRQREYLRELDIEIPHLVVAAHFFGTPEENRKKALADYVAVLGDLKEKGSAKKMAQDGELKYILDIILGDASPNQASEKTKELQNIAKDISEKDDH